MQKSKPVLLVEDNSINVMAVRRVFNDLRIPKIVVHSKNGEEALKYLSDDTNEKPDLILLDLNMPVMNGIEFLKIIKDDSILKSIPVVMLTTSDDERDIAECFDLNVAGYIIKPFDLELFHEIIRTVATYWNCSESPNGQDKCKWHKMLSV
ncbi:response regulator [Planctomycetota bacterium]